MDVVNLHEAKLSSDDYQFRRCLVTDNILTLTGGRKRHFTIYVVLREDVHVKDPFGLIYYDTKEDVSRLSASFVEKTAFPMWDTGDFNGDEGEWPEVERYKGEYIKLDFFCEEMDGQKRISYTWTDWYEAVDAIKPVRVRALYPPQSNVKMGLYLILPFDAKDLWVFSEKAFGSYKLDKHLESVSIQCCICRENASNMRFIIFECKHLMCCVCHNNNKSSTPTNDYCPSCHTPATTYTYVKVRHGPCPIDTCKERSAETKGTHVVPCGCYIPCRRLQMAVEKDKQKTIEDVKHCPYDACRLRITDFVIPFVELGTNRMS